MKISMKFEPTSEHCNLKQETSFFRDNQYFISDKSSIGGQKIASLGF